MDTQSFSPEYVVLVDENDNPIGTMLKRKVHNQNTPLHRAFSLYIFNQQGQLLLQQRKKEKITWGGFWSNSCCGHPGEQESREEAAKRRAQQELGVNVQHIQKIENYRYRFEHNNVVENEICPLFAGMVLTKEIHPDPAEIENIQWMPWSFFLKDIQKHIHVYSPWAQEQAKILAESLPFQEWVTQQQINLA